MVEEDQNQPRQEEEISTTTSLSDEEQYKAINKLNSFYTIKCRELGLGQDVRVNGSINLMLHTMDECINSELKLVLLQQINDRITLEESHPKKMQ